MILVLDNYDSFVFNLARYLAELGEEVRVVRNDGIGVREAAALEPSHIVVSPGPCTPAEAGVSTELIGALGASIPTLGVCLGHQCVGAAFGTRVVRAGKPMHGKISLIHHDGSDLFTGLPTPLRGTRYHSLVLDPASIPPALAVTARSDDGEVMAVRHRELPVWGVQFHPEAVLTEHGYALLANFLALGRGEAPRGLARDLPVSELARLDASREWDVGFAAGAPGGGGGARPTGPASS